MKEKLIALLANTDIATVKTIYAQRILAEKDRSSNIAFMQSRGFEQITAPAGSILDDGREVILVDGICWVIKLDIVKKKLAEAEAYNKANRIPAAITIDTLCIVLIGGQLCGGELQVKSVCPSSTLGKSGVRAVATCSVCGTEFALR